MEGASIFAQFSVQRVTRFTSEGVRRCCAQGGPCRRLSSSETVNVHSVAIVLQLRWSVRDGHLGAHVRWRFQLAEQRVRIVFRADAAFAFLIGQQ